MARNGALIVGFNLCFDLARLACKWPEGDKEEWSLVLSEHPSGDEKVCHPRVLVEPIDSKKSFIRFRSEWIPEDGTINPTRIYQARFLDLRTLLWALFNQALSLQTACELGAFKKHNLPKKIDHKPTGQVTIAEIEYARQDVRCSIATCHIQKPRASLRTVDRASLTRAGFCNGHTSLPVNIVASARKATGGGKRAMIWSRYGISPSITKQRVPRPCLEVSQ